MEKNKTGKYLKYAIGEIILVVIGILIALQINNWNSQKLNHDISVKYHKRMISDIDQMLLTLDGEIERAEKITSNLEQTVSILENQIFNDINKANLDFAMSRYFQLSSMPLQISSFEEMKSTGQLNLIYNLDLRQILNKYSNSASVTENIVKEFSASVNGRNELFDQYIRVYVGKGANMNRVYDPYTMSKNATLINTFSRFSYDWNSYVYFLRNMLKQLKNVKDNLQKELNTLQEN